MATEDQLNKKRDPETRKKIVRDYDALALKFQELEIRLAVVKKLSVSCGAVYDAASCG